MLSSHISRRGATWTMFLLIMLLLAGLGAGTFWFFNHAKAVATVRVERGNVIRAFYATGVVRPDFEYPIKSRAQGAIVELAVREGARVAKGELLARVDDKQLRFEMEKTQAELREAQAQGDDSAPERREIVAKLDDAKRQSEIAQAQLKRNNDTYEKGVGTLTDVEQAQRVAVQWSQMVAQMDSQVGTWQILARRRIDVAQANLRKAQADLADSEMHSPIDGIVLERYVEANQVVGINERLFLLADPNDKLMKAAVDEEDIARTFIGQKVYMQLYAFNSPDPDRPPRQFEGRVKEILPTADPVNKTFETKVEFLEPPKELRVGMTAELNFIEAAAGVATTQDSLAQSATQSSPGEGDGRPAPKSALVVPATAVMDGKVYLARDGRYEAIDVTVGVRSLEKCEIIGNIKEGDIIVADAKQVAPIKLPKAETPVVPTRTGDKE